MEKRLFAIGMRGWVEVRSASTPPHRHESALPIKKHETSMRQRGRDVWGYPYYVVVERHVTRQLKHVAFSGGKVVEVLSKRDFHQKYKLKSPDEGTLMEIKNEHHSG